jgi:hypothetical protein
LRHCLELVSVGGHFIAASPANQFMGHGFYQFSPEAYFRVFTAENGFRLRKMVLYKALKTQAPFYEVSDPAVLEGRAEIRSSPPVLLAVMAQRTARVPLFSRLPQQSDYVAVWNQDTAPEVPAAGGTITRLRSALSPYWPLWLRLWKGNVMARWRNGSFRMARSRSLRRLSHKEILREEVSRPTRTEATTNQPAAAKQG